MTMLHEEKPDINDYILEHYGVKGMKWGVRRSQAALDRAAGRTTNKQARADIKKIGGTPHRGMGKRSAWNGQRATADIKSARKRVKAAKAKTKSLENKVRDAKNPSERAKAVDELTKARAEYDRSNDRVISSQLTLGESAAVGVLAIPAAGVGVIGAGVVSVGAMSVGLMRSQKHQNRRWNIDQAEFMEGKTYAQVAKASKERSKKG